MAHAHGQEIEELDAPATRFVEKRTCPGAIITLRSVVPELTRNASIQLTKRFFVAKLSRPHTVYSSDIAPRPGFTVAKPSGDHIPLGGFVLHNEGFCADAKGLVV